MRKLILLASVLTLTGCATMYQQMGLATKDDVASRDQRIQSLESQVKDLSAEVTATKDSAQKIAQVEALMRQLEGRVDLLPQDTLRRLADILSKAAAESSSPAAPAQS